MPVETYVHDCRTPPRWLVNLRRMDLGTVWRCGRCGRRWFRAVADKDIPWSRTWLEYVE